MIGLILGYIFLVISSIVLSIFLYGFIYFLGYILLCLLGLLCDSLKNIIDRTIFSFFDRYGFKVFIIYLIFVICLSVYENVNFTRIVYNYVRNLF